MLMGFQSRQMGAAIDDGVAHQPQRGARREYPLLLRHVFLQDVVLHRAPQLVRSHALFFGNRDVHGQGNGCGGRDRHRRADLIQGDAVEQDFHVGKGADGDAAFADFPGGHGVIGVVAV